MRYDSGKENVLLQTHLHNSNTFLNLSKWSGGLWNIELTDVQEEAVNTSVFLIFLSSSLFSSLRKGFGETITVSKFNALFYYRSVPKCHKKDYCQSFWVLIGSISPPKLILSRPQISKQVTGLLKNIWKGTRYLTVVKSSILAPLKSIRYQFIRMLILKWLILFRLFYNIVVEAIVIFNNIQNFLFQTKTVYYILLTCPSMKTNVENISKICCSSFSNCIRCLFTFV